jgi:perosamine synthetase
VGNIPLSVPEIGGNEWAYVKECLDSGWVSSAGPFVERFEREFAARVGTRHAVAVVNGTAALHVALLVAGVEPDDEVLVSALTFIAPVNAIRYANARPVLMDAEADYWQMDPQKVCDFLRLECRYAGGELRNRQTGRRVKAIIPVHILGHPVDLAPVLELAREYGVAVIEDATESLGAEYRGRQVGHWGELACFSFNGNKLITTGGGGMLVTDDDEWARRARHLTTQAKLDPVEYVHDEIGFNYRLTNVQAALGCAQLERLDEFVAVKRRTALRYNEALGALDGATPMREAPWARSAWWLYTALFDETEFGLDSRALLRRLGREGIQTRPLWQPLHRSIPHRDCQAYHVEVADWIHQRALSLPCSVGLSEANLARVIEAIRAAAEERAEEPRHR